MEIEALKAKLLRETTEHLQYVAQTVRVLVNPDGPEAATALTTLQAREATLIRVLDDLLDYALVHCSALTEESSIVVRAKEALATSELVER